MLAFFNDIFHFTNILGITVELGGIALLMFALCEAAAVFMATMGEVEKAKQGEREATAEKVAIEKLSRMKTEFLQDIKHEVRNPLHVISLGTDFVNQCIDMGDMAAEARNALITIQNEALRLGRMVNGMVELATMDGETASREKIDFTTLLSHAAETARLQLEKNCNTLRIEIAPGLPYVYGSAEQLERVPRNILENANNFTQGGEILLEASAQGDYITVRISDSGSGIDPVLIPRLFERGISGSGGKGYGLSMCKTIVEAYGGTIGIESGELKIENEKPFFGTCVTFTIPVYGGQREAGEHEQ
jgi:signal transduction histidine kinase